MHEANTGREVNGEYANIASRTASFTQLRIYVRKQALCLLRRHWEYEISPRSIIIFPDTATGTTLLYRMRFSFFLPGGDLKNSTCTPPLEYYFIGNPKKTPRAAVWSSSVGNKQTAQKGGHNSLSKVYQLFIAGADSSADGSLTL